MKLRGIEFGNVLSASGVQGCFGEGYWFHKVWHPFGLDFTGTTLVSKTATLLSREGHMALTRHYTPRNLFPDCVKVKPFRQLVLNSVGLSNPSLGALLGTGKWQNHPEPFLISIMSLADTPKRRLEELRIMVEMLGFCKDSFISPFGLQINLSCPNTGHDPKELIGESSEVLAIASKLGVPVMLKYSIASAPIRAVLELDKNPDCDAICVSNTLPFGWQDIDWQGVWGTKVSPLAKLGGGGLSGKSLRPLVCEWISHLRDAGFTKPINGGGGILCEEDVQSYYNARASSIFLGSVAILRPWRVEGLIDYASDLNWK